MQNENEGKTKGGIMVTGQNANIMNSKNKI